MFAFLRSLFSPSVPSRPSIAEALAQLEKEPDIADFLLSNGHILPARYEQYSASCPVAQYLTAEVGAKCSGTQHGFNLVETFSPTFECGPRVFAFIVAFDSGQFPELRVAERW